MTKFTGNPDEAEADLRRASDALTRAQDDLAEAKERVEAITQEPFDGSPEAEEDISRRVEAAEREVESLQQDVAGAEDYFHTTHDFWVEQGYLPS